MNTKAQISDIDLTPDVDLTESRLDILPYKGIMDCNSPHVGGVLNNVYKKKIDYKAAEFIQQYGGAVPLGWYNKKSYVLHPNSASSSIFALIECVETGIQWKVRNEIWERKLVDKDRGKVYLTDGILYNKPYLMFNQLDSDGRIWVYSFSGNGHTVESTLSNATSVSFAVDSSNKVIATYGASTFGAESALEQWVIDGYSASHTTEPDTIYNFYGDSLFAATYSGSDWKGFIGGTWSIENKTTYGDYPVNSIQVGADLTIPEYFTDGTYNHRGECNYYPSKGIGLAIYDKIPFALYYNNTILTYDVQTVLWSSPNHCVYIDNENNVWECWLKTYSSNVENLISKIENGKVYFKGIGDNVFDLKEEKLYKLNYAYFDNFFFKPLLGWQNHTSGDKVLTNVVTGIGEQFNIEGNMSMSPNFPMHSIYLLPDVIKYDEGIGIGTFGTSIPNTVNIYYSSTSDGGCDYQWSIKSSGSNFTKNNVFEGVQYPLSDGNTIISIPLWSDIDDIGNNTIKVEVDGEYYICLKNDKQENLFAYYLMTMNYSENLFLVQTGKYTVLNGFIYQCSFDKNVFTLGDIICECEGLKFLGAFPLMAFFWSELDKSIYVFTGDNNLRKFKEAYRIDVIKEIFCDPTRQILIINTNIGCILLYEDSIFRLSYDNDYIYPIYKDGESYVIGDTIISFSNNDTETAPEVIYCKTELYGEGRMIKSINDCVFIRVIKSSSLTAGSLKIKSYALTETTMESSEQTFTFSDSDFDINGQLLIQYQPQYQAGVGFNVELESTHPIAYMGISHQPEAIQQSLKGKQNVIASPVSKPGKNFKFE